jgi:small subunit ribosomal protein S15
LRATPAPVSCRPPNADIGRPRCWKPCSGATVLTKKEEAGMSFSSEAKQETIQTYRRHDKDSGSPEVQIAILTKHILELTEHMRRHPKDHHSRHGLLMKVNRRNKLLAYLKRADFKKFNTVADQLGLRK